MWRTEEAVAALPSSLDFLQSNVRVFCRREGFGVLLFMYLRPHQEGTSMLSDPKGVRAMKWWHAVGEGSVVACCKSSRFWVLS